MSTTKQAIVKLLDTTDLMLPELLGSQRQYIHSIQHCESAYPLSRLLTQISNQIAETPSKARSEENGQIALSR